MSLKSLGLSAGVMLSGCGLLYPKVGTDFGKVDSFCDNSIRRFRSMVLGVCLPDAVDRCVAGGSMNVGKGDLVCSEVKGLGDRVKSTCGDDVFGRVSLDLAEEFEVRYAVQCGRRKYVSR